MVMQWKINGPSSNVKRAKLYWWLPALLV
uniref:Uncharacterized protein n=1 Tax=Arundo donax TaxID=35708 RepID=A0A0A9G692_ARUDO